MQWCSFCFVGGADFNSAPLYAGVAHLARALPCQGRGSEFKPRRSLVYYIKVYKNVYYNRTNGTQTMVG